MTGVPQRIVTVSGKNLKEAGRLLAAAIAELPGARVTSLVSDIDRLRSFSGRATLVAVVEHD